MTLLSLSNQARDAVASGRLPQNPSLALLTYMANRWLQDEIRRRDRKLERAREKSSTIQPTATHQRKVSRLVSSILSKARTDWTDLLDETFALPDGTRVTWRAATASQHLVRAEFLERMGAGVLADAALHREAVAVFTAVGGSSLGDVS